MSRKEMAVICNIVKSGCSNWIEQAQDPVNCAGTETGRIIGDFRDC